MSARVAAHNARVAVDTTDDPSGRPGGSTGLTRPIYRLRSRGRIEVLTARGNWQRKALIPPNGIQVADAPLTESDALAARRQVEAGQRPGEGARWKS